VLKLNGDLTVSGNNSGLKQILSSGSGAVDGTIDLGGAQRTFTIGDGIATPDMLITARIINGSLRKSGAGVLSLTAANAYADGTTLADGAVEISDSSALGSGPVAFSGGRLNLRSNADTASFTNLLVVAPADTMAIDIGRISAGPDNTFVINAPTFGSNLTVTGAGTLRIPGGMLANDLVVENYPTVELAGALSGGFGITRGAGGSAGTLILSGAAANTYTGPTRINGGTLQLAKPAGVTAVPGDLSAYTGATVRWAASHQVADNATVAVNGSASLIDLNGFDDTISAVAMTGGSVVSGAGTLTVSGNVTTAASTATANIGGHVALAPSAGGTTTFAVADGPQANDLVVSAAVSGTGAMVKAGAGTMLMSGANTLDGTIRLDGGTLAFASDAGGAGSRPIVQLNGGNARFDVSQHLSAIVLAAPGVAAIKPGGGRAVVLNDLAAPAAAGAQLDLADNKLIVHGGGTGSWNGIAYVGVTGLIQSGRNAGAWNGSGIVTSMTAASTGSFTSIGVATAAQAAGIASTATSVWGGQTVTGSDTLVMYTYGGDANLDGKLNVDDYGRIDSNIGSGTAGWYNGDFNYDGKVNVDDYGIIDSNIGIQGAPFFTSGEAGIFAGTSAVPEPGTSAMSARAVPEPSGLAALLLIVGVGSLRRHRRWRAFDDPRG
jgi:autotransporter-associated beta strand protein